MNKILFFLFGIVLFSLGSIYAQEICNNGLDDDNDGLVDCFDPECKGRTECNGFFYPAREIDTVCKTPFALGNINEIWQSGDVGLSDNKAFAVADIDKDNIPEIIIEAGGSIGIFDGSTGTLEASLPGAWGNIAVGDIDNDGYGEIIVSGSFSHVKCFEHDGSLKWNTSALEDVFGVLQPGIADFNSDGNPEVFIGKNILDANTGALIYYGGPGGGAGSVPPGNGFSIAADVLDYDASTCPDCEGLELIWNNEVYRDRKSTRLNSSHYS